DLLLRGRFAAIWWPRIGLELASLVLIAFGGLEGLAAECALATLPGVLLTSSLTSHGAALVGVAGVGIVTDWLHILGATGWIGGLIAVLVGLPAVWRERAVLLRLLGRFSRFALLASAIVLVSGVAQAVFEVGSWSALLESGYGKLVLVKVGLLVGMVALAGFNTRYAGLDASRGELRIASLSVWAELALGVIVLGVASVLTGTPPASS
ncbi:MAG: CopD family protein, partial [Chloroflexota bacterium]|nr:CopD family protein [Chloroflexota bacterium]